MIVKKCIIIIDESFYVTKDLKLSKNKKDSLIILGRRKAKNTLKFFEKHGIRKAKIKFLD